MTRDNLSVVETTKPNTLTNVKPTSQWIIEGIHLPFGNRT